MTSRYQKELEEIEQHEFKQENKIYHLFDVYLVGGAVRDLTLGIEPKDKDYVVVGATEKDMLDLGFEKVGADFPVFLHPKTKEEYALARRERKIGVGYNGFVCETNDVTIQEDLLRRDLTINAMAIKLNELGQHEELIDPYCGAQDLNDKILKHVSHHFSEDPVRILRIARFAARYNFEIHEKTKDMMRGMVNDGEFDALTPERVFLEFEKVISEKYLSRFFHELESIGALSKLGIFDVKKIEQDLKMTKVIQDAISTQVDLLNFEYQEKIMTPAIHKIQGHVSDYDFLNHARYPVLLLNETCKREKSLEWGIIFEAFTEKNLEDFKVPNDIQKKIKLVHKIKNFKSPSFQDLSIDDKLSLLQDTKATHQKDDIFSVILYAKEMNVYHTYEKDMQEARQILQYYKQIVSMDKKIKSNEILSFPECKRQKNVVSDLCVDIDKIHDAIEALKSIDYEQLQKDYKAMSVKVKMRDFIAEKQKEALFNSEQSVEQVVTTKKSFRM